MYNNKHGMLYSVVCKHDDLGGSDTALDTERILLHHLTPQTLLKIRRKRGVGEVRRTLF